MLIPHFAKRVFENKVLTALFIILSLLSIYFYVFSLSKKALVKIDIHSNITTYFKIYWAKIARITNTLKVQKFWVTENCLSELSTIENVILDNNPVEIEFDHSGRIKPI